MSTIESFERATRPAAGTWAIDPGHAEVAFVGRHFGLTKIRGRFAGVAGTVVIGDDVERSTVEVTLDMASVASGDRARDDHLRSPDFFDVERYPTASFASTAVRVVDGATTMTGTLTIKERRRPVELAVEFLGEVDDPWGNRRAVFSASGVVDREDWGLTWNMPVPTGGLLVSRQIRIEIEVELVREASSD
jgi:polyisoprenoid-binding protein YceI